MLSLRNLLLLRVSPLQTKIRAAITAVNGYVPDYILTNKELEKLVDTTDGQIWWAADEVFDTANPKVVNSARRHQLAHQKYNVGNPLLADSKTVLMSPRRLGQYTVDALFSTLPER